MCSSDLSHTTVLDQQQFLALFQAEQQLRQLGRQVIKIQAFHGEDFKPRSPRRKRDIGGNRH